MDQRGAVSWPGRGRAAWWAFVLALGALLAYAGARLPGTFLVGLFVYYGVRPVQRRVETVVDSQSAAATITLVLTALPFVAVTGYFFVLAYGELVPHLAAYQQYLAPYVNVQEITSHPIGLLYNYLTGTPAGKQQALRRLVNYVGLTSNLLANAGLAGLVAFTLLRDGHRLRRWFRRLTEAGPAYAFACDVDSDLEAVYFSNVLLVGGVAVGAEIVFEGYNALAPAAVAIPFPTVLAVLLGLTTLVPLVVGKIVYLPLVGYLAWQATLVNDALIVYPAGLLVVCFVCLDFVPMTFVLPELAGHRMGLRVEVVMFGYVVGAVLFGWFGLFLGPLVVVLVANAATFALGPLVRGEPLGGRTDDVATGRSPTLDGPDGGRPVDERAGARSDDRGTGGDDGADDGAEGDDGPRGEGTTGGGGAT